MAAGGVNKVILIGNLGSDPELRFTGSGKAVANFRMATNEKWKDKDGKPQERVEWHSIVVWEKPAEIIQKYCKKGSKLYVEGRLQTRSWDDKDGNKRYTTEVVCTDFMFLDGKKDEAGDDVGGDAGGEKPSGRSSKSSGSGNNPPPPGDDEIPF